MAEIDIFDRIDRTIALLFSQNADASLANRDEIAQVYDDLNYALAVGEGDIDGMIVRPNDLVAKAEPFQ